MNQRIKKSLLKLGKFGLQFCTLCGVPVLILMIIGNPAIIGLIFLTFLYFYFETNGE